MKQACQCTILTDNAAGGHYAAEHGLSYFLRISGSGILFDSGHSDIYLQNAARAGLDLFKETDVAVLSHGHWDHGDGFRFWDGPRIALHVHPAAFMERRRKRDGTSVGLSMNRDTFLDRFELREGREAREVGENVWFLGEIPRVTDFEARQTSFEDLDGQEDFVPDDSALAVIHEDGLAVITGCSHSGICNICEYARAVTGVERITLVAGGFHLKKHDEQTLKTIDYFRGIGAGRVYPSHCTELPALAAFYPVFGNSQLKTGMVLEF